MQPTDWSAHWKTMGPNLLYFRIYRRLLRGIKLGRPTILELGAGTGMNTVLLLESYGGSATLVDNNHGAKKLFGARKGNLKADYREADVWKFRPKKMFDMVHSEGLVEHFHGRKRQEIFDLHAKWLKKDGIAIILAPVRCTAYSLLRRYLAMRGRWYYTDERPFTVRQLAEKATKAGLEVLRTEKPFWAHEGGIICRKV